MAEPLPPVSLTRAREQKISELSEHFANDDLSLEDLERRIERVYRAGSLSELEAITSDLRVAAPLVDPAAGASRKRGIAAPAGELPAVYEVPQSRLLAIMSSTRRVGRWAVPRDLSMFALMSDTMLDLTAAALPIGGVVNIQITGIMASMRIIVPPGMRVINEIHSVMSEIGSEADDFPLEGGAAAAVPAIRLSGTVVMSEFKVKVRRREETSPLDDVV